MLALLRFRTALITALWTLAITLMACALVLDIDGLGDASVLVGLMALAPTCWYIVDYVVSSAQEQVVAAVCEAIGYVEADSQIPHIR